VTARLSLPLRLDGQGRFVTVDQDSPQALAESVGLLLDTRPGERRSVPDYGYPSPLFSQTGVDPDHARGVISQWEDAGQAEITTALVSNGVQSVTVELGISDEEFA
jgi:hypothetical protein